MSAVSAVSASTTRTDLARWALLFALLGLPGVTMAWDLMPHGGFIIGVPLAVAAVAFGRRARGGWMARSAIIVGAAEILFVAVCTAILV